MNIKIKTNIYNKNNKMKKSELKELIRTSLLEEMEYDGPSTYTDKDLDDLLSIVLKYVEDPNDAEAEIAKFDTGGFDAMSSSLTANLLRDKDYNDWYNKLHSIEEAEEDKEELDKSTAKELFNFFKKEDLIDDRREYDIDDLMSAYPGLSKIEAKKLMNMLNESKLRKTIRSIIKEEEEDVEVEDDVEVTADEKEGIDVKQDAESDLTGVVGDVQDNLEAALEAARKLGDEKLVDQIGNTLTFFTRTHVVKEAAEVDVDVDSPAEDAEIGMKLDESITRMKKLAGLIK